MDFDFPIMEDMIQRRGTSVTLETGVACFCRNSDVNMSTIEHNGYVGGRRTLSCPKCFGDQIYYVNPRKVVGLITSISSGDRKLIETGFALPGDCIFSPSLTSCSITDLDKITFCIPTPIDEGQVITRGSATIEDNQTYVTDLLVNEDRLWYNSSKSVWCEDENGVVYVEGTDFNLSGKKIVWENTGPSVGTIYTIKYTGYLEWIVYSTPMTRYDSSRSIGQRVLIRKKHVVNLKEPASGPNGSFGNTVM